MSAGLAAACLLAVVAAPAGAAVGAPHEAPGGAPDGAAPAESSIWAPPRPRGLTRVEVVVRPFFGVSGNTWGGIADAHVEHYFWRPFLLGVEMAPLAVAHANEVTGAIAHLRVRAAYVSRYLMIGFAAGVRLRRFATGDGATLAPVLRLGALDGLNLTATYDYGIARNHFTGRPTLGLSNITGTLNVPLGARLALVLDGGGSTEVWAYGTIGLRERLTGDWGPGTWIVSGAFGFAWVSDRTICNFEAVVPCPGGTALSYGPTISAGLERRF